MRRRTVIFTETETLLSMTKPEASRSGWCDECASDVLWVDPEMAVQIIGTSTSIVVHISGGLICSRSLKKVEPCEPRDQSEEHGG